MVNEELVGGLSSAISRGESLEKAMQSFYQAGYKKEEIEQAAAVVQSRNLQVEQKIPESNIAKDNQNKPTPTQKTTKVSEYNNETKKTSKRNKFLIGFLIVFSFFLIAALVITFIFKDNLMRLI